MVDQHEKTSHNVELSKQVERTMYAGFNGVGDEKVSATMRRIFLMCKDQPLDDIDFRIRIICLTC